MWDKEEHRWIDLADDLVSETAETSFAVEVAMAVAVDEDGKPEGIVELRSRDIGFLYIKIDDPHP